MSVAKPSGLERMAFVRVLSSALLRVAVDRAVIPTQHEPALACAQTRSVRPDRRYSIVAKNAVMSSASRSGSSKAAKCPPRGMRV
jgi:hypothetical protein